MNVRGERIIVFGDSTSKHGADNAPEIWDVDAGSGRVSGQPGDLLASMLVEQGAAAARVNARVGRSAHNFWGREDTEALLGSDQEFAPTKVIVILGTNDMGLDLGVDQADMERIRDVYKSLGAEVWGVGPWAFPNDQLNQQAAPVADMMREVFGSRFIDPRPITAIVGRAGDGVHFGGEAARQTAAGLLPLVQSASTGVGTLWALGLGFLAAVGGAFAYSRWKSSGPAHSLMDLGETCSPQMSEPAFKRCVARQKRAALGDGETLAGYRVAYSTSLPGNVQTASGRYVHRVLDSQELQTIEGAKRLWRSYKKQGFWAWVEDDNGNHVPIEGAKKPHPTYLAWRKEQGLGASLGATPKEKFDEIMESGDDVGTMDVAEDFAEEHELKLSRLTKGKENYNTGSISAGKREVDDSVRRVWWQVDPRYDLGPNRFELRTDVLWTPNDIVSMPMEIFVGTVEQARKMATANAWALTRKLRALPNSATAEEAREAARITALSSNISRKEHLYGLGARHSGDTKRMTNAEAYAEFNRLLMEPDPESMEVAQDIALEHDIKLSKLYGDRVPRGGYALTSLIPPDPKNPHSAPRTHVGWHMPQSVAANDVVATRHGEIQVAFRRHTDKNGDWHGINVPDRKVQYFGTWDYAKRAAAADSWAVAKAVKKLPDDATETMVTAAVDAALDQDNSVPAELFGLGKPKRKRHKKHSMAHDVAEAIIDGDDGLASLGALAWKKTGKGTYRADSPHGEYTIDGNGYGRQKWTVTYPSGDYGMVDALAEAKIWAEQDATSRTK